MTDTGIFYVATGKEFVDEAEVSAQYIREVMPNIPIAIATDVETDFGFDYIIDVGDPEHGFVDQIHNLHLSPFEKTLYFDTDIYVNSDITELFDLLDKFDIGAAYNHNRNIYDPPGVPDSFPEYNTGVVVYRNNNKFHQFTQTWEENYTELVSEDNTQNQPSFRKTLYESNLRITTLTSEYNCMVRYPGHVRNEVKIAHSRLLDIQTPGASTTLNVIRATEKLNNYEGHRLFLPHHHDGVTILHARDISIHWKVVNALRRYGIINTVKKGLPYLIRHFRRE